jgi:signal transduction histidine kinase
VVSVEDDGPGVAESVRTTLFKPFTTTKATGTGLGLAFCKKIADEHGGELAVTRSPELGGARFELRLPRQR